VDGKENGGEKGLRFHSGGPPEYETRDEREVENNEGKTSQQGRDPQRKPEHGYEEEDEGL
jgi:hypothetical protein